MTTATTLLEGSKEEAVQHALQVQSKRDAARRTLDASVKPLVQRLGQEGSLAALNTELALKASNQAQTLRSMNKAHARVVRRDKANRQLRLHCRELLDVMSVMTNMPNNKACDLLAKIEAIVEPPLPTSLAVGGAVGVQQRKRAARPWAESLRRHSTAAPGPGYVRPTKPLVEG